MGMDFTADGRFLMLNSSGMGMVIVNAEACKKASPKDMKALRYPLISGRKPKIQTHVLYRGSKLWTPPYEHGGGAREQAWV